MGLIILIAALAIDVSSWYTKHHQAQVTADSAALAAANYMSTTPSASPATATTQATTYAADNGLAVDPSNVDVNTGNDTVTVIPQTTGPLEFAGIALKSDPAISARAVATWGGHDCSQPGSQCAFLYGGDNVCPSPFAGTSVTDPFSSPAGGLVGHGVTMRVGGASGKPEGGIISNSNLYTKQNGSGSWNAYGTYSNQANCTDSGGAGDNADTVPPFLTMGTETPSTTWPIDYSKIYPACPGTSSLFGNVTCDASSGFPSYCTQSVVSSAPTDTIGTTVAAVPNDVYCDAGTTGTKSDPSTWNGEIVQGSALTATYIAGTASISPPSNNTSGPASGNRLWIYAAEGNALTAPTPAVQISSSGNATIYGDVFAPSGTIAMSVGGTISAATVSGGQEGLFLEGWDVVFDSNGSVAAGGPTVNGQGQLVPDVLTQ